MNTANNNSPEDEPNNPPPAVGAVEDPPNENPPPLLLAAAAVGGAAAADGAPLPVAVDPLNGGGFTAGVVDVNGGVEGAVPNENAVPVAGAGVVGALAGVDLPNTAVVLLPHVTMIIDDDALFVG